jgi:hypothetical protein
MVRRLIRHFSKLRSADETHVRLALEFSRKKQKDFISWNCSYGCPATLRPSALVQLQMQIRSRIGRLLFRYAIVAASIAIAAAIFILQQSKTVDPILKGRRYSAWVNDLIESEQNSLKFAQSAAAISECGTNGFPFLIQELTAKPSWLATWKRKNKIRYFQSPEPGLRQMAACQAVTILGTAAGPLENYVTAIMNTYKGGPLKALAIRALAASHPGKAFFLMTNGLGLAALPLDFRLDAARFALRSSSDPQEIITVVLTNSRPESASGLRPRIEAFARELKSMPIDQSVLEKTFIMNSTSRWTETRKIVAIALPVACPHADSTPLILQQLCLDTNSYVRWAATNSLRLWKQRQ